MSRDMVLVGPNISSPIWTNDVLTADRLLPGGAHLDASQFSATDAVTVVTTGAAQGATAVPVAAITGAIPNGTVLDFGGAKFARLTAGAVAGAVSLTVTALPTALVNTDTATYAGVGKRAVVGGTFVGRTYTERDAGTGFGPAATSDDELYLTAFTVPDVTVVPAVSLIRPGLAVTIKEDFLPGWANLSTGLKTALRARYLTVRGEL